MTDLGQIDETLRRIRGLLEGDNLQEVNILQSKSSIINKLLKVITDRFMHGPERAWKAHCSEIEEDLQEFLDDFMEKEGIDGKARFAWPDEPTRTQEHSAATYKAARDRNQDYGVMEFYSVPITLGPHSFTLEFECEEFAGFENVRLTSAPVRHLNERPIKRLLENKDEFSDYRKLVAGLAQKHTIDLGKPVKDEPGVFYFGTRDEYAARRFMDAVSSAKSQVPSGYNYDFDVLGPSSVPPGMKAPKGARHGRGGYYGPTYYALRLSKAPSIAEAKTSRDAQKFMGKEIAQLMKKGPSSGPQKGKKMGQKQAVAVAYSVARKKGFKVPKKPRG